MKNDAKTPVTGGVTDKDDNPNQPKSPYETSGSEPVRDKKVDETKGRPVTRFFTKDGTPVEPSTIPRNYKGEFDLSARPDVVPVVEYLNEDGSTLTHDGLKQQEKAKSEQSDDDKASK